MSEALTVIARNSVEMAAAQDQLKGWAANKLLEILGEKAQAEENLEIARKHKWKISGLQTSLRTIVRRFEFYQKMKAAVDEGYVIIPNFPIDVFAIRTEHAEPQNECISTWRSSRRVQGSEFPPFGDGEYVSENATTDQRMVDKTNRQGEAVKEWEYYAGEFQSVTFPIKAVKPQVLDDVGRAMALKIFDEIGILPARRLKVDPMVVGQIAIKKGTYDERRLSFLITWWLSEEHLLV